MLALVICVLMLVAAFGLSYPLGYIVNAVADYAFGLFVKAYLHADEVLRQHNH